MPAITRTAPLVGVLVMGAGGRDFHNLMMVLRGYPRFEFIAFTVAQIQEDT